jgi:hypothetical protein
MDNSHKPLGTGMIVAASLILLLLLTLRTYFQTAPT